jgi:hypothetical protein
MQLALDLVIAAFVLKRRISEPLPDAMPEEARQYAAGLLDNYRADVAKRSANHPERRQS